MYVWLSEKFKILVCFVEIAIRRFAKKYIVKIQEKNLSFHSSGDSRSITTDIGGVYSIWSNITSKNSLHCGVMMGHWPNITQVPANPYPKLLSNGELLNFLIFVAINYCELKPFLEMVLWSSACWLTYWLHLLELWLACKSKVCDFWLFFTPLDYTEIPFLLKLITSYCKKKPDLWNSYPDTWKL